MPNSHLMKLALMGGPGAGKDTFTKILRKKHPHLSIKVLRLAEPLYEVQNFIYHTCSRELDKEAQDGVLLNFLGKHLRSINPQVLLERFARSIHEMDDSVDILLCSDARPIDIPFVKQMGFTIIHIATDPELALERRKKRGDLSLSNSAHETECGITEEMYDIEICNNSSLEEFEKSIEAFLKDFEE